VLVRQEFVFTLDNGYGTWEAKLTDAFLNLFYSLVPAYSFSFLPFPCLLFTFVIVAIVWGLLAMGCSHMGSWLACSTARERQRPFLSIKSTLHLGGHGAREAGPTADLLC
jgi:hypothetical protein